MKQKRYPNKFRNIFCFPVVTFVSETLFPCLPMGFQNENFFYQVGHAQKQTKATKYSYLLCPSSLTELRELSYCKALCQEGLDRNTNFKTILVLRLKLLDICQTAWQGTRTTRDSQTKLTQSAVAKLTASARL